MNRMSEKRAAQKVDCLGMIDTLAEEQPVARFSHIKRKVRLRKSDGYVISKIAFAIPAGVAANSPLNNRFSLTYWAAAWLWVSANFMHR